MIAIYVLIDALGWQYLKDKNFLDDILPHRLPMRTVLGFSSGAIPTILTGVPPAVTGHWNLFYFDPKASPFRWLKYFSFLPDAILDNRYSRKIIKELGRRVLGMGSLFECSVSPRYLPWFNYVEKKNIYDHGGISGAKSIFDDLEAAGIPHKIYSYHHLSDAEIVNHALEDLANNKTSFFFLYLSEMDMFLHMNCNDPVKVEERLQWYDQQLRRVYAEAKKHDPSASMTVISDHGMTPIENHFDLVKQVNDLELKQLSDYLVVYDSTMARFWFFNENARERIQERLASLSCGRILSDDELKSLGIYFSDRRFGELVFLLNPGWLTSESDFNGSGKGWMPKGMHGYHPEDPYSDAIFLSSSAPPFAVRALADVYPCMRKAAGLPLAEPGVGRTS